MKRLLLIPILLLTGCASAGMKSGCGHVTGNGITVPYVGGKADGNAYGCYMTCLGSKCPVPDYTALQQLTSDYIKIAGSDSKMTTTGAGTITFTPSSKQRTP